MKRHFAAPWAASLKWISFLSTAVLLALTWAIPLPGNAPWPLWAAVRLLGVVLLGGCALYTVRGYELAGGCLNVRRLLWKTRIPLRSFTKAELRPGSFGWAWRTFGNGGLYSFSGWYYQKPLGSFRALATRLGDAVILHFADRKPIVVTPEDPAGFVEALKTESAAARA